MELEITKWKLWSCGANVIVFQVRDFALGMLTFFSAREFTQLLKEEVKTYYLLGAGAFITIGSENVSRRCIRDGYLQNKTVLFHRYQLCSLLE